jgi:hypothetical protein
MGWEAVERALTQTGNVQRCFELAIVTGRIGAFLGTVKGGK